MLIDDLNDMDIWAKSSGRLGYFRPEVMDVRNLLDQEVQDIRGIDQEVRTFEVLTIYSWRRG